MHAETLPLVPRLATALRGPLLEVESRLLAAQPRIEEYFRRQWRTTPPPFYSSVDLRNSGFKVAPVDTNLFPAGFNNLNPAFKPMCVQAVQAALERSCPTASRILVVPENHTRNPYYHESLATLVDVIRAAGYDVRIGALMLQPGETKAFPTPSGREVVLEGVSRDGTRLVVDGFRPCAIILNNDLSGGRPPILEGLTQTVLPPVTLGWSDRRKSDHFSLYAEVAAEFGREIDLDPWFIDPLFRECGEVDFMKRGGEECLASNVDLLLMQIRKKYDEYGIDREPFVIVKADAGTYGMGVMSVRDVAEVRTMNRDARKKMAATKEGRQVTSVIIQEGVHSSETFGADDAVAEPVVYMIDRYVVGGFYRVHSARSPQENLNAPGARFEPLAFAEPCNHPVPEAGPEDCHNRFYAYGVVARLALTAAAREVARETAAIATPASTATGA
jgi:glutamate--cysteine ligase